MKTISKMVILSAAVFAAVASSSSAFAQGFYGPPPVVMMPRPYFAPPMHVPMYNNTGYYNNVPYNHAPNVPAYGGGGNYNNGGMGVDLSPVGPYAGAATGRVLMSNPYTAPFAPWAAGRVNANAESAGREYTPGAAAVRTFTGVSPRDIQQHGLAGGPNSEVRKIGRFLGF